MNPSDRIPLKLHYRNCTSRQQVQEHYPDNAALANYEWTIALFLLKGGYCPIPHINENINSLIGQFGTVQTAAGGDVMSAIFFDIHQAQECIEISGFTMPAEVEHIDVRNGLVNTIFFKNGERFPKNTPITIAGINASHAAFFKTKQEAEDALLVLSLALPPNWNILGALK